MNLPIDASPLRLAVRIASFALLGMATALAEVRSDGRLGSGVVGRSGSDYTIPGAAGLAVGTNLFHSFARFDIEPGGSATFQDLAGIRNVLARVTEGGSSQIDGRISCAANLFLMNPQGFIFGPQAVLDVTGAFTATSAGYLALDDGLGNTGKFFADRDAASSFSSAPVSAFGFLPEAPKSPINTAGIIEVKAGATLTARPGQSISLIGGDLQLGTQNESARATLRADGGRVELASVKSAGELRTGLTPLLPKMGAVRLNTASIRTDGAPGGRIVIRGGTLTLEDSSRIISGAKLSPTSSPGIDVQVRGRAALTTASRVLTQATGAAQAGDVSFRSGALSLAKSSAIGSLATEGATAEGRAGRVVVRTGALTIGDGSADDLSTLTAASLGQGRAGTVDVHALTVSLLGGVDGGGSISATSYGSGRSGVVKVEARELRIDGRKSGAPTGLFSNQSTGASAPDFETGDVSLPPIAASKTGPRGRVSVKADTLRITASGSIAANTETDAPGGDVEVTAGDLFISAPGTTRAEDPTGIFADTFSKGAGGNVRVTADRVRITEGGLISTKAVGLGAAGDTTVTAHALDIARGTSPLFTGIAADAAAAVGGDVGYPHPGKTGPGGNVRVSADTLRIYDGGQISANTATRARGGNVSVEAGDLFLLGRFDLPSAISAESLSIGAGGAGGNVDIVAQRLRIADGARISAATVGQGAGGDIQVRARDLAISGGNLPIVTGIVAESNSAGAGGPGGDVRVVADRLALRDGGRIEASTRGGGAGGSVWVTAARLTLENAGAIEASALGRGAAGSVTLTVDKPLTLRNGSAVRTTSAVSGAGTVSILSATDIDFDASGATVQAARGDAGLIRLQAGGRITLTDSPLLAEAGGNGGSIFTGSEFVILANSRISANALLIGGNIVLIAANFLSSESALTATGSTAGTVAILAPELDLAAGLVDLSVSLIDASTQLREQCARRLGLDFSSLLVLGREGVSLSPEDAQSDSSPAARPRKKP